METPAHQFGMRGAATRTSGGRQCHRRALMQLRRGQQGCVAAPMLFHDSPRDLGSAEDGSPTSGKNTQLPRLIILLRTCTRGLRLLISNEEMTHIIGNVVRTSRHLALPARIRMGVIKIPDDMSTSNPKIYRRDFTRVSDFGCFSCLHLHHKVSYGAMHKSRSGPAFGPVSWLEVFMMLSTFRL